MNLLNAVDRKWVCSPLTIADLQCLQRAAPAEGLGTPKGRAWLESHEGQTLAVWLSTRHLHENVSWETAAQIVKSEDADRLDRVLAAVAGSPGDTESANAPGVIGRFDWDWSLLYRHLLQTHGLPPSEVDSLTLEQLDWLLGPEESSSDWVECLEHSQVVRSRERRHAMSDEQAARLAQLPAKDRRQIEVLDDAEWSRFVKQQLTSTPGVT